MNNHSIVSASSTGNISVYNIDMTKPKSPKLKSYLQYNLDYSQYGSVVDITEITTGGQNVLVFVTTKGKLCGLDLRTKDLAWELNNDPKYGTGQIL